ncbi:MAG: HAD family hydrolase [Spirochaetia bacterium]|jgi:putative hydrolase of the HAD superfamily|nr:HAD family hydrolase [Spirochaetia bacterium]
MGFVQEHSIKALCLDIDGTLYPKRMLNLRMIRSVFPSLALGLRFNAVRQEYRIVQEEEGTKPANRDGLLTRQANLMLKRFGEPVTEKSTRLMRKRIDHQFYDAWKRTFRSIRAYEHMREALELAKGKGLEIVAFSDFPVAQKLKTLGIADLVDVGLSSEDSGYLKPSPKAFSYLLDHVGARPGEVLYVGDSYTKDCQGAKRAGMRSALITSSKREYSDADLVISSWKEFISLVF